jgi:hypothetical protein
MARQKVTALGARTNSLGHSGRGQPFVKPDIHGETRVAEPAGWTTRRNLSCGARAGTSSMLRFDNPPQRIQHYYHKRRRRPSPRFRARRTVQVVLASLEMLARASVAKLSIRSATSFACRGIDVIFRDEAVADLSPEPRGLFKSKHPRAIPSRVIADSSRGAWRHGFAAHPLAKTSSVSRETPLRATRVRIADRGTAN